jgi:hypothetical protein
MIDGPSKDRGDRAAAAFESMRKRFGVLQPILDERAQRWWVASEAWAYGHGGLVLVHEATGMAVSTIRAGLREIASGVVPGANNERSSVIRRSGGGRKPAVEKQPGLVAALEKLVDPATRGDPMSPLRWTSKSVQRLTAELKAEGYEVSPPTVAALLKERKYSLQGNRKTLEGASHPDRDAQFQHIAQTSREFLAAGEPVVSVDTKKKELIGPFKNGGREYQPQGRPERVRVHDFKDPDLGKAIPYGVYDLDRNTGWVNVGVDHDTAEFAVESLRGWWKRMGADAYPEAGRLLVTADCGGSNGYRTRGWKCEMQRFANESGLAITVCHFPPGTSKWNKIEHRLFSQITHNWRGRPLISHEVVVNLIANTTTKTGLAVQAGLDTRCYQTGRKISDEEMARVALTPAEFHGEWNYTIRPQPAPAEPSTAIKQEKIV